MFCRKCGNQFDNSLDFCPQCNEPAPESAQKNSGDAVSPPSQDETVKCPQCLHDNKPGAKFCAACGCDMTKAEQPVVQPVSPEPEFSGIPDYNSADLSVAEDGTAAAKPGLPIKAIIIGAAAVLALLIIMLIFLGGSGSKKPVPALLNAAEKLVDEVKDAKGMHIELDIDGEDGTIDYQLNMKKKQFVFYVEADGIEMGGYIYADEGRVARGYKGDYYTEKIKSSEAESFWAAIEGKNYEDIDFLTDCFGKKNVDKAVKSLLKGLNSKQFQDELAETLEIEYDKKGGEYTYSAELNAKSVGEAMEVLFEMVEERTEEYAARDFDDILDECFDVAKEIKSEGKKFSLGDVEWVIKKGKLQSFEYEYEYYNSYWDEKEKYAVSGEFEYGFGGLNSIEISGSFDGDKFSIEISDIGKVDDVKDLMSKSMVKELKLNK